MRDLLVLLTCFCLYYSRVYSGVKSIANSGQLSYVGLHLVGLPFVQQATYLPLKTIILDHA